MSFGPTLATDRVVIQLHLLESVYDGQMEVVFVDKVVFEVVPGQEVFRTEWTAVATGKLTEELVETEVMVRGSNEVTAVAAEEWKVALVHTCLLGERMRVFNLFDLLSGCRIVCVFVDEMGLKKCSVLKYTGAEWAVETTGTLANALVVVGPVDSGGNE
jgi:hypothetical protein